jgi:hypothetical protein
MRSIPNLNAVILNPGNNPKPGRYQLGRLIAREAEECNFRHPSDDIAARGEVLSIAMSKMGTPEVLQAAAEGRAETFFAVIIRTELHRLADRSRAKPRCYISEDLDADDLVGMLSDRMRRYTRRLYHGLEPVAFRDPKSKGA